MTLSFHLNSIISPFSTSFTEKKKEKENYFSYILLHSLAVFRAERMFPCQSFRLFLFNELLTVFILFYASSTCKKLHSLEETRYTSMSNHYDRLFSSRHESRVYKKTGNGGKLFECVAREIQVKHREDILMGSEYYFCDNKSPSFSSLSCLRRDIKRRTRFLFFFLVSGSSFSLFDKIEESVV